MAKKVIANKVAKKAKSVAPKKNCDVVLLRKGKKEKLVAADGKLALAAEDGTQKEFILMNDISDVDRFLTTNNVVVSMRRKCSGRVDISISSDAAELFANTDMEHVNELLRYLIMESDWHSEAYKTMKVVLDKVECTLDDLMPIVMPDPFEEISNLKRKQRRKSRCAVTGLAILQKI